MIKMKNVYKKYKHNIVIKNMSYKFNKGIYLIKGKSGKGKTTLLNILSGIDKKYEGKIEVNETILYFKDKDNLPSNLTVKEIFYLFEQMCCLKIEQYFDVGDLLVKKIKKLSLGELQLVVLTLVLNSDSRIIMLDEPFSALSLYNLKKAAVLLERKAKGKLVIIATHNDSCFRKFALLDLDNFKSNNIKEEVLNVRKKSLKNISFNCYLLYAKKTLFKKIVFIITLFVAVFNYFYIKDYVSSTTNKMILDIESDKGNVIERESEIITLSEDVFYEIIKKLSKYAYDYNANYYNSKLYEKNITVNNYYIDNGFVLSSIKYIEEPLLEDELIMGFNYQRFCKSNNIGNCDENYLKVLLVNKVMDNYKYVIKDIFESEETIFLSNKRFNKIYENNEHEEYYFDIKKENEDYMFKLINEDLFLLNFEFIKIGESSDYFRYVVECSERSNFDYKNIGYSKYIACLDEGYDCFNYLIHFDSLVGINNFKDIEKLELEIINEKLTLDEIVVSSKLAEELKVKTNDNITFYFNYNDNVLPVDLVVKKIINSDEYYVYHNSEWSYYFFKDKVGLKQKDLIIKNIVVYDDVKKGYKVSWNAYQNALKEVKDILNGTNNIISVVNLVANVGSVFVVILIELFYNRFKKEYFEFLRVVSN